MKGAAGLTVDNARAVEYFKRAAELKYPDAQVNMGLIYLSKSSVFSKYTTWFGCLDIFAHHVSSC